MSSHLQSNFESSTINEGVSGQPPWMSKLPDDKPKVGKFNLQDQLDINNKTGIGSKSAVNIMTKNGYLFAKR